MNWRGAPAPSGDSKTLLQARFEEIIEPPIEHRLGVAGFKIGPQIMQFMLGARYWVESPEGGPEGWGLRVQLTLLYPK